MSSSKERANAIRESRYPKDSNTRFSNPMYERSGASLKFNPIPPSSPRRSLPSPRFKGLTINQPPKVPSNNDESEETQIVSNLNYFPNPSFIPKNEQNITFYDDTQIPIVFSIESRPSSSSSVSDLSYPSSSSATSSNYSLSSNPSVSDLSYPSSSSATSSEYSLYRTPSNSTISSSIFRTPSDSTISSSDSNTEPYYNNINRMNIFAKPGFY